MEIDCITPDWVILDLLCWRKAVKHHATGRKLNRDGFLLIYIYPQFRKLPRVFA